MPPSSDPVGDRGQGTTEQALARMRATLESTRDAILATDQNGEVTVFNERLLQLWQLPGASTKTDQRQLLEAIGAQLKDPATDRKIVAGILRDQPPETFQVLELADGRRIERYSKTQVIEGRPAGRVWSFREASHPLPDGPDLHAQREWLEVTLASIGDAVLATDAEARVIFLNPVAEHMTGWKRAEAKGKPLREVFHIIHEHTREPAPDPISAALESGTIVGLANHTALISRDHRETAIEDSAAPIRDAAGRVSGAVMVFRDVTQRRRADRLLRESEARLSAIFNQAAVGMATAALDGRFEQVNQKLADMLGYSATELREKSFRDLTHPDDGAATDAKIRRLLAGEIPDYSLEKRYVRKDGRLVWSLSTVTVLKDEEGQAVRFVGVLEDITQRRAAEDALQARERELSLIYHNVSDVIFYLSVEPSGQFRFVTVNRAFLTATGLAESQVVGKRVEEVSAGSSFPLVLDRYREAIRERKTVQWEETTNYPSGRKTGAVSITPIFDATGKCINLIGTIHDVTARRQSEELSARLAAVVESSDDAIVSKTLDGVVMTWNKGAERTFGFAAEEMIGKPINLLIPPDRQEEEPEILRRIRRGERVDHFETVRQRKDGTLFDVSVTISPIRDAKGTIIGASKIARDISAQKKAAAVLRESEERYRLMGDVVPHLLWMTDATGRPTYFNDRWYAYTGENETTALAALPPSVLHPDDRPGTLEAWRHAVETGAAFEHEYRLRRHDGAFRWFVARGVPLRDDDGKITRWYGSSTDIHEQKLTAEALREQYTVTEQLNDVARALAAELDLGKIVQTITDAGTRITRAQFGAFFYNHVDEKGESYTLYTLSGAPREAFAKFPMPRATEVFGPTFRGEGVIRLDDVRQDPRFGKNAPYHGMPAGHLPVVSYLAVPVVSRGGEVIGGLFFGHPQPGVFTERDEKIIVGIAAQAAAAMDKARLYLAEQHARAAAERASQAKDDFLATLSHELRNPLNPILLIASEAAQNRHLPPEIRSDFEMIQRNVELEARLIDDLLDLTRITRRKMSLELQPVDIHESLQEAIAILGRDAEAKNINISTVFLSEKALVMADSIRLQQIFWNVLRNAVKFTPEHGRVTLRTRKRTERHEVEVEVTDTGMGMTPAEIRRIFDAFTQGDHASSTGAHRFGGLGLGLAIAQHLAQMHGGRIEAESPGLDQGSTFRIIFPLLGRDTTQSTSSSPGDPAEKT